MLNASKKKLIKQKNELELLANKYLIEKKIKNIKNKQSKLYLGELSPSCKICIDGDAAQILLTRNCTRKCFFCPHNRHLTHEIIPIMDRARFFSVKDFVDYVKKFKFKGIGFSGGEALTAFKRLIDHMSALKMAFKNKIYIFLYTNGDLATEERLKKLKEAGLDEIKFDLAARNYDLKPVKLAKKYIKNVTIETPVIPEDYNILIKSLEEIQKLKVNYINLHKLVLTQFNKEALIKRKYVFTNYTNDLSGRLPTAINSEIAILKLFKHIEKNNFKINVNFCPFQSERSRKQYSKHTLEYYESLTQCNLIRRMEIENPSVRLMNFIKNNFPQDQWKIEHKSVFFLPDLINQILPLTDKKNKVCINYYVTSVNNATYSDKQKGKILKINNNFSINLSKNLFKKIRFDNVNQLQLFELLIIKKMSLNKITNRIIKNSEAQMFSKRLQEIMNFYYQFNYLEFITPILV